MQLADGCNRLALCVQKRMKELDHTPPLIEFGEIQSGFHLMPDSFRVPIPPAGYTVCRSLTWGGNFSQTNTAGDPLHSHTVPLGNEFRRLQIGDRVLIAWVNGAPCVIDLFLPATVLG